MPMFITAMATWSAFNLIILFTVTDSYTKLVPQNDGFLKNFGDSTQHVLNGLFDYQNKILQKIGK